MGPDWRADLGAAPGAHPAVTLLQPARAACTALGYLAGRHDLRRPPRHLNRGTILGPDASTTDVVRGQTGGRRNFGAGVVTHRITTRRRRFPRSRPALE